MKSEVPEEEPPGPGPGPIGTVILKRPQRRDTKTHIDSIVHALYACPGLKSALLKCRTPATYHTDAMIKIFEGLSQSKHITDDIRTIELLSLTSEPLDFLKSLLMELHRETMQELKPGAIRGAIESALAHHGGKSAISDFFGGLLETQIYCVNCLGDRSTKLVEFFVVLEIPLPGKGRHDDFLGISDCLEARFKREKLDEPERICETCSAKKGQPVPSSRVKVQSLTPPPSHPIFAIVRQKVNRRVPIRLKEEFKMRFNIDDPLKPSAGIKRRFVLYAAIVQVPAYGQRKFGCVARHRDGWYKFADDKLTKLGDDYEPEFVKKAEILFYRMVVPSKEADAKADGETQEND